MSDFRCLLFNFMVVKVVKNDYNSPNIKKNSKFGELYGFISPNVKKNDKFGEL